MKEIMNYHATSSNNGLDWFDDSISSFLAADADADAAGGGYAWWAASPVTHQDDIGSVVAQTLSPPASAAPAATSPLAQSASPTIASSPSSSSKKRKSPAHGGGGGKKGGGGGKGGSSSEREMRWAEQLLNPCAAAADAGNMSRVQHLFYVLAELQSFTGDANHRLAAHGLRALSRRLPAIRLPLSFPSPPSFSAAEPRLFRASLIRFHELSPWFALPNALTNAAISAAATSRPIHVVDIGVSHGVQWPTLLESLTRQPGGRAPPSVRITVVGDGAASPAPFAAAPAGYYFSPHLLRYAKSIGLDLAIARAGDIDAVRGLATGGEEALVVCLQFRLGHAGADERREILRKVRGLGPELVVLSELDFSAAAGGGGGGGVAGEFAARLEMLWRFLESTSAAFKGKDAEERRLMEAEAGTSLADATAADVAVAGDGRDGWRERMAAAGFEEAAFGAEAVESAKSLLRKYDSGWEMSTPPPATASGGGGGAVALRWKGQPVSFCSLWRPAP
uniref:Uncharacterized protein n=1 Tax=Leersia perrieri TaxID=77586 RepID=A0A0D9VV57_9ORYZ